MVSLIIWSNEAKVSYEQFIGSNTTGTKDRNVYSFKNNTQATLELLKLQPQLGLPTIHKSNVRKVGIHKRIDMVYRYIAENNAIELLLFYARK